MYTINKANPYPIIDLGCTREEITTGATQTDHADALMVWLNTANLGGGSECFVSGMYDASTAIGTDNNLSFGVALQPLDNLGSTDNVWVDLSIAVSGDGDDNPEDLRYVPFIGFISSGLALGAGWDANNTVANYAILPGTLCSNYLSSVTQVLIRDIVSASIPTDAELVVGFSCHNGDPTNTHTLSNVHFTISARYMTANLDTSYTGV